MIDRWESNFILGWDKQAETEKSQTAIERDILILCVHNMDRDNMERDNMDRDNMARDSMVRDNMERDNMDIDNMDRDNMVRDNMDIDNMDRDNMDRDNMDRDNMVRDNMVRDNMERDNMDIDNMVRENMVRDNMEINMKTDIMERDIEMHMEMKNVPGSGTMFQITNNKTQYLTQRETMIGIFVYTGQDIEVFLSDW